MRLLSSEDLAENAPSGAIPAMALVRLAENLRDSTFAAFGRRIFIRHKHSSFREHLPFQVGHNTRNNDRNRFEVKR